MCARSQLRTSFGVEWLDFFSGDRSDRNIFKQGAFGNRVFYHPINFRHLNQRSDRKTRRLSGGVAISSYFSSRSIRRPRNPPDADPRSRGQRALAPGRRSEEHTSELQSLRHLVCRLLLEKKNKKNNGSAVV